MEAKGFKDRQCRSLGSTNHDNRYRNKLVGDTPEFMPLDNNLFADFSVALTANVCATRHLPSDHPSRFSLGTPKSTFKAMKRTWEHSPTSDRIVEDIERFIASVDEVNPEFIPPTLMHSTLYNQT